MPSLIFIYRESELGVKSMCSGVRESSVQTLALPNLLTFLYSNDDNIITFFIGKSGGD